MQTIAILPVKSFDEGKARLRSTLSPEQRQTLSEAMFRDVLISLRRTSSLAATLVVTGDYSAQRIAGSFGAHVIDDADQGHNPAAREGLRIVLETGADRALLVAGDCPTLASAEIDALLARPVPARSVLVVPDRHGTGTNALLLTPPDVLSPSFGLNSCRRHLEQASAAGTPAEIVEVPSLALDVDTGDDLDVLERTLARARGGSPHTRGAMIELGRSRPW